MRGALRRAIAVIALGVFFANASAAPALAKVYCYIPSPHQAAINTANTQIGPNNYLLAGPLAWLYHNRYKK